MARFQELLADPDHNNQNVNFSDLVDYDKIAKSNTNTYSEGDSHGFDYTPDTNLDKGDITPYDLPHLEDERANAQDTIPDLAKSFAKFAGKTVLSTIGNLAGTIYGVGSAIANGQVNKIWDNSFMDAVDAGDKKLDNIFQVYKNSDYQDQNILQKAFLHPTQFVDEATDTASFMAGAVLSEIATSGLGSETIIPRALKYMKYLSEGAEASEATNALTSLATKGIVAAGDFGTSVKHLAMGASYEGIVEARQATMELRQKMLDDYSKDHPNEAIPQSVQDDIDSRLSDAGGFTYLANLALVGGTNLLLFPKLFGLGHDTAKLATGAIEKDAESGLFESATSKRLTDKGSKYSMLQNIGTVLEKPVEESTKFGVQGTISKTAKEFWDRKNDPDAKKDVRDFISDFGKQLVDTYTSKEGWDNIGMGMIIGALGAPGRGILSPLGESNPLGKYGFRDVLDENGQKVGSEKLPSWTGGVKGSFDERTEQEHKIGKVLNDLNQNTDFFKAAKANYDTLVENRSLQVDQDKALQSGDIFNFQNSKDDQIHSYVSSRIKNNLYDDLLSEVDNMKKLSPDEFYNNFKGDEAADNATNIEKIKFQQSTTQQFLDKAQNTRDAIKIADDVYRGDNEDLRDHLTHSIAASKNLDLREQLMNQSLADLSGGMISNLSLAGTSTNILSDRIDQNEKLLNDKSVSTEDKEKIQQQQSLFKQAANLDLTPEEHNLMSNLANSNPTSFTLNKDKIERLLQDSRKLRAKRQDYLDIYNHLFTQQGQKQFEQSQQTLADQLQKQADEKQKQVDQKEAEKTKQQNIKETLTKAEKIKEQPVSEVPTENLTSNKAPQEAIAYDDIPNVNFNEEAPTEAKNESTEQSTKEPTIEETNTQLNEVNDQKLTPEETAVVVIDQNNQIQANRDLIVQDTGLVRNAPEEHFTQIGNYGVWNLDLQRTIGNTISYLGIDKVVLGRIEKGDNQIKTKTFDTFDEDGNLEVNQHVDTKLFSQNYYKVNSPISFEVPTYQEMEERGLQNYTQDKYAVDVDNAEEYPIAIRGEDDKIVGYLPTQSGIKRLVDPEFVDEALASNLALRTTIYEDRNSKFKGSITSKSPGMIMLDKRENQKSLFDALGDKEKIADKVKLGILKPLGADVSGSSKDLYIDNSQTPFKDGEVVNGDDLKSGVVYAIVPSSATNKYIVYPMKVNSIGEDNAKTIVEAIKLFHLSNTNEVSKDSNEAKSIDNIREFNISNFKDLTDFVNRIMYSTSNSKASDNTIFKLFKDNLVLSSLDRSKIFSLQDIATSQATRDRVTDILKDRYYSVGLENLNTNNPYISYNLEDGVINQKENTNYQSYINDNKALTSNIRNIPIEGNERVFTTQPVMGVSDSISKDTKQIQSNTLQEETTKPERAVAETPEDTKGRLTKKKLNIDPNKLKGKSYEDLNPEFIDKGNVKSGDDLMRKCL